MSRILAFRKPGTGFFPHYYIVSRFFCRELGFFAQAIFIVDTGATRTTVIADALGLRYEELEAGERMLAMGGWITPRMIHDVRIAFFTEEKDVYMVGLDNACVIDIEPQRFTGVLGLDVLDKFPRKTIEGNNMYLEF